MIDDESQVSLNHSSVLTNVFSSDKSMAQVSLVPKASGNYFSDASDLTGKEETYDRRLVKFFNITGTVEILASAQYYIKDLLGSSADQQQKGGFFGGSQKNSEKAQALADDDYRRSMKGDALKFSD